MTVIAQNKSSFLDRLAPAHDNVKIKRQPKETLGQSDFLQLLTTQLKNQDPLKPIDNEAFVAQMAQFSSVAGISEMNSKLNDISGKLGPDPVTVAASLVGKSALVASNKLALDENGKANIAADLPPGITDATLRLSDSSGRLLRTIKIADGTTGLATREWDGTDNSGRKTTSADILVSATGKTEQGEVRLDTFTWAKIDRASVQSSGKPMTVYLSGIGEHPVNSIRQISN